MVTRAFVAVGVAVLHAAILSCRPLQHRQSRNEHRARSSPRAGVDSESWRAAGDHGGHRSPREGTKCVRRVPHRRRIETCTKFAFLRAAQGPYVAIIPKADVRSPSIAYTVELEPLTGERKAVFASRDEMQAVEVPGDLEDERERAIAERLDNRRSVVSTTTEYVVFGQRSVDGGREVADRYWRVEASYTYRPLRTVAEFGIRAGVVRGPNPSADLTKPDLGLNYGAPSIRVRLRDICHMEGEFLTSVTASGFSVGTGGAVFIGDPYGSKLTLGFESIQGFGSRVYSRVDIAARRNLTVSPIVEVTDAGTAHRGEPKQVRRAPSHRGPLRGGLGIRVQRTRRLPGPRGGKRRTDARAQRIVRLLSTSPNQKGEKAAVLSGVRARPRCRYDVLGILDPADEPITGHPPGTSLLLTKEQNLLAPRFAAPERSIPEFRNQSAAATKRSPLSGRSGLHR